MATTEAGGLKSEQRDIEEICQKLQRDVNCLTDENRNTRRRALEKIKRETLPNPSLSSTVISSLAEIMLKPLLKMVSDPVEKCRNLAIEIITGHCELVDKVDCFLPYILPVAVSRVGGAEMVEPSEEVRLQLVQFLSRVVERCDAASLPPYLSDFVTILQRMITDPYPEIKKVSCQLCMMLAPKIPDHFHMKSESLMSPLVTTLTHQHYRVRVTCLKAIGVVVQYSNAQCIDTILSHLAQRTFDRSAPVRSTLVEILGGWLLDHRDRYSYHHKLLPLLLSGITDEIPDIRKQTRDIMEQVGCKYADENKDDLKDKLDWDTSEYENRQIGEFPRPSIGSRVIVCRCWYKVLPAVMKDMADWTTSTRLKAVSLLEILLIYGEENATHHLEMLLHGLYKSCLDDDQHVVQKSERCAWLLGYFIKPDVWCHLVLPAVLTSSGASSKVTANVVVSSSTCTGCLITLGALLEGSNLEALKEHLVSIADVLVSPEIRFSAHVPLQVQLLAVTTSLIHVAKGLCAEISYPMFQVLVSVTALSTDDTQTKAWNALEVFSKQLGMNGLNDMFVSHSKQLLAELKTGHHCWVMNSPERRLFDLLVINAGSAVCSLLDDVMEIFTSTLEVERDAEMRLSFFSLLSQLLINFGKTEETNLIFQPHALAIIRSMILPNCVWSGGRTAAAIRTAAMSCLWALLQNKWANGSLLEEIKLEMMTQVTSCLDDSNQSTRLVSCKVLRLIFMLLESRLDVDALHQMYPDLLKRMDDNSDSIRMATIKTLSSYFSCFPKEYDRGLYRAHMEAIYRGMLIHLDDPSEEIQDAMLGVLKEAAVINPTLLKEQLDNVRHKHRVSEYCDKLSDCLQQLL
ncbi:dynein axonemal assembly factor 5-like [Corticium candelabrum]|uniref:dynein axonemal assembly factor 5-like n=1 Tax=Corticium candelabrum TaxID=121492 RepID=UPI002E268EEA|nr:dynein axonemal assembly factor 5-like [Corticium candelabrum]